MRPQKKHIKMIRILANYAADEIRRDKILKIYMPHLDFNYSDGLNHGLILAAKCLALHSELRLI